MTPHIRGPRRRIWAQRVPDFARHLGDLADDAYEGARDRGEREAVFRQAVDLLDPVVRDVLTELDTLYLGGVGQVGFSWVPDAAGLQATWSISWAKHEAATRRPKLDGPPRVDPIQISVIFPPGWTHGHIKGSHVGHWPLQVLDQSDAERQYEVIWAVAEAELHEWIYTAERPWESIDPMPPVAALAASTPGGRVKRMLSLGQPVSGIFIRGTDGPDVLAAADQATLDFVIVDREHGVATSDQELGALCEIGFLRGIAVLVRLRAPLAHLASAAMDLGASGVVIPQCRTAAEVEAALAGTYLPPVGSRGFSPRTRAAVRVRELQRHGDIGDLIAGMNASTLAVVQVETAELLANLPAIAGDRRADAFLLGAHDLAVSMGNPTADVTASALEGWHQFLRRKGVLGAWSCGARSRQGTTSGQQPSECWPARQVSFSTQFLDCARGRNDDRRATEGCSGRHGIHGRIPCAGICPRLTPAGCPGGSRCRCRRRHGDRGVLRRALADPPGHCGMAGHRDRRDD